MINPHKDQIFNLQLLWFKYMLICSVILEIIQLLSAGAPQFNLPHVSVSAFAEFHRWKITFDHCEKSAMASERPARVAVHGGGNSKSETGFTTVISQWDVHVDGSPSALLTVFAQGGNMNHDCYLSDTSGPTNLSFYLTFPQCAGKGDACHRNFIQIFA